MKAYAVALAVLAFCASAQAQVPAHPERCANALQPSVAPGDDGFLHAYATLSPECSAVLKVSGWEVSNDGRIFEPAHETNIVSQVSQDGDHLRAQGGSGLTLFRPVLTTHDGQQVFTAMAVPVSLSDDAAAKLAKLRLPSMAKIGGKTGATLASATGTGGAAVNGEARTGVANDGTLFTRAEEGIAEAGNQVSRLSDALNYQKITGPYTSGTGSVGVGGGVSRSSGGGSSSSSSSGTTTPTPAATPPVQTVGPDREVSYSKDGCTQRFTLQSPKNTTLETPARAAMSVLMTTGGECGGAQGPVYTFEASRDGKTYEAMQGASFLTGVAISGEPALTQAEATVPEIGKVYFRLHLAALDRQVRLGPITITATAPTPTGPPPAAGTLPGYVGGKLEASQGTVTGAVALSWNPSPSEYRYNVYRWDAKATPAAYVKLNSEPVSNAGFRDEHDEVTVYKYIVRSIDTAGVESADSLPATGYSNAAPTAVTSNFTAYMNRTTDLQVIFVSDENFRSGQKEEFQTTILEQPPAGQGTAFASGGSVRWQPPTAFDFVGTTTFRFQLTDKGGASIEGVANVSVVHPQAPAPTGFEASLGTLNQQIGFRWKAMSGYAEYIATGYNIYNVDVTPPLLINPSPILGESYTYDAPSAKANNYQLRAITTVGESLPTKSVVGYANAPITAVSVPVIAATQITESQPTSIIIEDENTLLGQSEVFGIGVLTQPSAGTATVTSGGKLKWTPPVKKDFSGNTTFQYIVRDKGGSTMTGIATVAVAPAATGGTPPTPTPPPQSPIKSIQSNERATVAPAAALECAKKFILLGESNALSTKVPVEVTLTLMKNEQANCGGVTPLETVFFASTDNRNFVPLDAAQTFVAVPAYVRNSVSDRSILLLTKPGTYYFRTYSRYGQSSVPSGVFKVTAR